MKRINLNFPVMGILNNPQTEWNQMRKAARGNIRTAFRDLNVDWKKYNTKDYLFTHDSIVCSVETESNGYHITKPCEELVNANGNAWKNEVLLHCFRTFIGGDNFCFPGGTRVLMSDGTYKNIEDVKIGDKVINAKGEIDTVVNTFCHSYTGKTITLKNPNILSKELTCTGNHPFYVYQDRGTSAVSGKPIKPQRKKERPVYDDVGLSSGERNGDLKESRWGHPKYLNASDLNEERNLLIYPVSDCVVENSEINENRAFLIGWFLAEGSYVNTDKGIAFSLSKDEKDIAEKICKLLEIEFPEKCLRGICNAKDKDAFVANADMKHAKFTVYKNPKFDKDSYIVIHYFSSSANAFFRKWCNEYSWAKCLPEEAMYLPLELQKTMLLQYIAGDGCYTLKSRGASVSSKSQKLIQQMRFIAIRLGVFPVYRETGVLSRYSESMLKDGYPVFIDPNTGKLSRPGYMLTFNCDDWNKLSGGDKPKHSSFSTKFENNFVFRFTKEEKDVEELIVYNFETEKDHSYIAEGVAVHNCEHIQIPALSKGKILDAIIRPVVHHSKYGDANIYMCFDERTKVVCGNGEWKDIGDLREGDYVYNGDGELTQVESVVKNKKSNLRKISVGGVAEQIICTNDHPFLVYDKKENKTNWVEAKDLSNDMWLIQPFVKIENGTNHLDKDFAWLLGFYLAEGSLFKCNKNKETYSCTQFTTNVSELKLVLEKIKKVQELLGEYEETIVIKNRWKKEIKMTRKHSGHYDYKIKGNGANIRFYYPSFANMCFNICGKGSSTKKINFDFFNMFDFETKMNFLAGYFDGDGNIRKQRLSVKSTSNTIIQQLSVILSSLQIPYKMYGSWWNKPYDKAMSIELTSHGLDKINKFMQIKKYQFNEIKIGKNNRKVDICNCGILRKIVKIEGLNDERTVVDIKVKDGRSFLVNGIIVHNCDILVATDRRHQELVSRIESGKLNTLSMGAVCEVCQCSICGKLIKDDDKNCEHLENYLGSYYKCDDGKKRIVAELCGALDENGNYIENSCNFIEASWVEHPAFEGAVVNAFIETEEEKIAREKSQKELEDLFNGSLFERLRVADTDSKIALNILKDYKKAEKYLEIARKIAKDNM